ADAEGRQGHRPQGALQPVVASHLGQQHLQILLGKQLVHARSLPAVEGLSRISVTGPSFTSSTCIMAPKRPVATGRPSARSASTNASYSGTATAGAAAPTKLGRRPL